MTDHKTVAYSRLRIHFIEYGQLGDFSLPHLNALAGCQANVVARFLLHPSQEVIFAFSQIKQDSIAELDLILGILPAAPL